jgi:hypothetical protein
MPINWFIIILLTAMIVTPISVIMDGAYMDVQGPMSTASDSIINLLLNGHKLGEANFSVVTATEIVFSGKFWTGVWKVMSADYSFFKPIPPATEVNWIAGWFRAVFALINFAVFMGIGIAMFRGVATS